MLLVMSTQGVFQDIILWDLTWKNLETHLPDMKNELFPESEEAELKQLSLLPKKPEEDAEKSQ